MFKALISRTLLLIRKYKYNSFGFSLLEQVAILPILLGMIFAAIDINTVIQARTALQAGLKTALRCVYPVDGKCVDTSPSPAMQLFHWFGGTGNISYRYALKDYDADVSWVSYPIYTSNNVQARILGNVNFSQTRLNYSSASNYFLMRARLPYLAGTESRNPNFVYAQQKSRNYPVASLSNFSQSAAFLSGNINSSPTPRLTINFSFSLPNRIISERCYQAINGFNTSSTANNPNNLGENCNSSGAVPVIVHLEGTKSIDADTGVQVKMNISGPGISGAESDLGGQEFTREPVAQSGAANFVPRGAISDANYLDQDIRNDGLEITTYGFSLNPDAETPGRRLALEPDTTYRITLSLENFSGSGSARWTPTKLNIYAPLYDSGPGSVQLGCFASAEEALNSQNYDPALEAPAVSSNTPCGPQAAQSLACGQNNGVSDKADSDGLLRNSAQAAIICPAPASSNNISWSETTVSIPHQETWEYKACGTVPSLPANLAVYPKLLWPPMPDPNLTIYKPIANYSYNEEKTPSWVLSNEPAYACGAFRTQTKCFDEDRTNCSADISKLDLLNGHEEIDLGTCAKERVRSELDPLAQQILGTSSYFLNVREKITASAKSDAEPEDSTCTAFRMEYKEGSFVQLTTEPLPAPQKPAQCEGTGALTCYSQFVGFDSNGNANTTNFDTNYAAEYFGFNEIQAALPRARMKCTGAYCIELNIIPVVNGDNTSFAAQASMEIPLNLLFGKTIKFTSKAKDSRSFEANFD